MKITVIFPTKNQTAKLVTNILEKGIPYYDSLGITYDFIIVSDASDEPNQRAMEEAMKSMPAQVKLLPYENHPGKGHNVQKGILAATGDYVMFMDADFATDLHAFEKMLPLLSQYDCLIATRHSKEATIVGKQPLTRRVISWISRKLIHLRFHFKGISDTQCGYKLFRTDVAKVIAKRQIIDGFAFDVEYLYFLSLNGFSIHEVPVIWKDDPDSTMHSPLKTSLKFYKDMGRIKRNKKAYLLSPEEKASLMRKSLQKGNEKE